MDKQSTLDEQALEYHRSPRPGKIATTPTKPLSSQRDLSLAYSPGVAAACMEIVNDSRQVFSLTNKGNLVGVITNGTAVLGLGSIGSLASKPVMEGKAVLFKKFAGIDCYDIELKETDINKLADIIASLEPTFGAINLEDIKAPECFILEEKLRKRMNIPVFHDDQHGTAIVACAAILNGLRLLEKDLKKIKLVSTGGGAAGIACLELLVTMGAERKNIWLVDETGVVYKDRKEEMNSHKLKFAQQTKLRTLKEAINNADVFLGLSAGNILTLEMVASMTATPLILALANPEPEIDPNIVRAANPNAVIATGRSDYPNQVNNVLCFPFIFRGALDSGATTINKEMKLAAVHAIADLTMAESVERVDMVYAGEALTFGPNYLIPKPFDPRLAVKIPIAVAKAAMESGVAARPIDDLAGYAEKLEGFIFRSGLIMKPIFERARQNPKRLVFAEGEDPRVLRAVQALIDEQLAQPILIGRPEVVEKRIKNLGLRIALGSDIQITNPESDPRFEKYWRSYHSIMERKGISADAAKTTVRTNTTVIAALMLVHNEADTLICGTFGHHNRHLKHILHIVGKADGVKDVSALSVIILNKGTFFLTDTHVTPEPTVDELVEMTVLAAKIMRRFGETPRVALLSHSNFGSMTTRTSKKMRDAVCALKERFPDLIVEGEMKPDIAIDETLREKVFPNSVLSGTANLLVFPNLEASNIGLNLLKSFGEGLAIGPILLGVAKPAHILTPSVTARGIFNMSALAVVDAQMRK
ncbi:MAG: NADP-dependent malic enzyme [Magnetovibrio sp.]|nr:NADP-dependent malic enzyme [Magnetovibrio sp.]